MDLDQHCLKLAALGVLLYTTFWLDEALAYNPRAKASPRRKPTLAKTVANTAPKAAAKKSATAPKGPSGKAGNAGKRHSIFDEDD